MFVTEFDIVKMSPTIIKVYIYESRVLNTIVYNGIIRRIIRWCSINNNRTKYKPWYNSCEIYFLVDVSRFYNRQMRITDQIRINDEKIGNGE